MYFPYLRGRQNELLCLRELLDRNKLSNTIVPVIEPVRCNSTFFTTIKKFIEADKCQNQKHQTIRAQQRANSNKLQKCNH